MLNPNLAKETRLLNPLMPVEVHDGATGARVMRIHYLADPEKRGNWAKEFRAKNPIPNTEWAREMDGDISTVEGFPVFPEYQDDVHCPEPARSGVIQPHPDGILIGCWDCSTSTINLAFLLLQIEPTLGQVQAILEVIGQPGEAMTTFAPRVRSVLSPVIKGAQVIHMGDPAGAARQGATGTTAFQEAYRHGGFNIQPSTNSWAERHSAAVWLLTNRIGENDEYPRFCMSGVGCPVLRDGFNGKYKWKEVRLENRQIIREPLKNEWSHIQDCFQYGAIQVRLIIDVVRQRNHVAKKARKPNLRGSSVRR